jgi:hypothetical protein
MKKIILSALSLVGCLQMQSQNSFGVASYVRPNSILSSGKVTTTGNPGFLLSGYVPQAVPNGPNISVDKLDLGGLPGAAPFYFQNDYQIFFDNACSSPPPQITTVYGTSALELTGNPLGATYGVLVSTNQGLAYLPLNNTGTFFNPAAVIPLPLAPISKAVFAQNPLNRVQGIFAVADVNGGMYFGLFNVNTGGLISLIRSTAPGTTLTPTDMIEDPFGTNSVKVVGYKANASSHQNGFFMSVTSGLFPFGAIDYDQTFGANSNNTFLRITPDLSATGGTQGYLVGGNSESLVGNAGKAWMLKLDASGNVIWSSVIDGGITANTGKIHAIFQRYSAANTRYENVGLCSNNIGITAYRLNRFGLPLTSANDEIVYNAGSTSQTWPVDISYNNTGASSDEGMHIFGNLDATPGNHYFVEAYFSGEAGCELMGPIAQVDQSAVSTAPLVLTSVPVTPGICLNITTTTTGFLGYLPVCGPFSSIPGGSNLRQITSIRETDTAKNDLVVTQVQGSNQLQVHLEKERLMRVKVYDLLGKEIVGQTFGVAADVNTLTMPEVAEGCYLVVAYAEHSVVTRKINFLNQ